MKLYYAKGTCSLVVRILLNEIGVACEFEAVDLRTKQTEIGVDYLTINVKGSVPALWLEKDGLLTENAVIQQFLVDTHQAVSLLPPMGDINRYRVLEWLNFASTELHKNCSPLFNPKIPTELKENLFKPLLLTKLKVVEDHLVKQTYLNGESFQLADIYLFVVLTWLGHLGIDLATLPQLHRFFAQVKERPAVKQALAEDAVSIS